MEIEIAKNVKVSLGEKTILITVRDDKGEFVDSFFSQIVDEKRHWWSKSRPVLKEMHYEVMK